MNVTDEELKQIQELQLRQTRHATMVGAAWLEFDRATACFKEAIEKTKELQSVLGETILKAHGIEPSTGEYRISSDGEIQGLVKGAWHGI